MNRTHLTHSTLHDLKRIQLEERIGQRVIESHNATTLAHTLATHPELHEKWQEDYEYCERLERIL